MKQYLKEMKSKFGYHATWEPGKRLKVGDIGVLDSGIFRLMSSLGDENIPVEIRVDEDEGTLEYTSEGGATISAKAAGEVPSGAVSGLGQADAGFSINFNKENAIVVKVKGYRTHQIANLGAVERAVVDRFRQRDWRKNWVIINELVEAKSGTILISSTKDAKIELKANANIEKASGSNIADASLGLSVVKNKNISTKVVAEHGITPLFRVVGVRKSGFKAKGMPGEEVQDPFEAMLDSGSIMEMID